MTPDAILALYTWTTGPCFRCGENDVFVTHIDDIATPSGDVYRLSACGSCVIILETERWRHAVRRGEAYEPGLLAAS